MVNDHADKGADDDCRIDLDHGSVSLPLPYVSAKRFIKRAHVSFPEHCREFVSLERGMQQQPVKLGIAFVTLQRIEGKLLKDRAIVFSLQGIGYRGAGIDT